MAWFTKDKKQTSDIRQGEARKPGAGESTASSEQVLLQRVREAQRLVTKTRAEYREKVEADKKAAEAARVAHVAAQQARDRAKAAVTEAQRVAARAEEKEKTEAETRKRAETAHAASLAAEARLNQAIAEESSLKAQQTR